MEQIYNFSEFASVDQVVVRVVVVVVVVVVVIIKYINIAHTKITK